MQERHMCIGNIRGLGPMLGVEFVKDRKTKEPNADLAKALVQYCYEHGLVTMTSGSLGNVIRLLMPLITDLKDVEEGLQIIDAGIASLT